MASLWWGFCRTKWVSMRANRTTPGRVGVWLHHGLSPPAATHPGQQGPEGHPHQAAASPGPAPESGQGQESHTGPAPEPLREDREVTIPLRQSTSPVSLKGPFG